MLQDRDTVLVRPVVENLGYKEDCDFFLARWLRVEEIVDFGNPNISARLWDV